MDLIQAKEARRHCELLQIKIALERNNILDQIDRIAQGLEDNSI